MIRNPHADQDKHQKLTSSIRSPVVYVCQVWSRSISAFVSYPVYKMTDTEHHNNLLVGGGNITIKDDHHTTANEANLSPFPLPLPLPFFPFPFLLRSSISWSTKAYLGSVVVSFFSRVPTTNDFKVFYRYNFLY